jgi:hypothetical protein
MNGHILEYLRNPAITKLYTCQKRRNPSAGVQL